MWCLVFLVFLNVTCRIDNFLGEALWQIVNLFVKLDFLMQTSDIIKSKSVTGKDNKPILSKVICKYMNYSVEKSVLPMFILNLAFFDFICLMWSP